MQKITHAAFSPMEASMSRLLTFALTGLLATIVMPAASNAQGTEEVRYYHTDGVGSVRVVTDTNGQVVERYDYQPFGVPVPASPTGAETRRFGGQELDAETGLDYFGARYYNTQLGRFTRADDRGFSDPSQPPTLALYVYVSNSPLRYVDPTGHCPPGVNFCIGVIAGDDALWIYESLTRLISMQVGPITPPTLTPTGEIAVCLAKGAAVGATGAVVVGVLAAGAAAAGAPVVAVTIALGVVGVVGGAALGYDVISQVKSRNWAGLAYDIGSLGGGAAAGVAGGRALAGRINRVPSPPWSLRSDWAQRYKPSLGSPSEWMGTGPNPGSAGGAAATAGAGVGQAVKNGC